MTHSLRMWSPAWRAGVAVLSKLLPRAPVDKGPLKTQETMLLTVERQPRSVSARCLPSTPPPGTAARVWCW